MWIIIRWILIYPRYDTQTCHPVVGTDISGGVLQTVLQGEVLQKFGKGGRGFHFWKIDRDFFIFKNFVYLTSAQRAAGGCSPLKSTPVAGEHFPKFRF